MQNLLGALNTGVNTVIDGVDSVISNTIAPIINQASGALNTVLTTVTNANIPVISQGAAVINTINNAIDSAVNDATDAINSIATTVGNNVNTTLSDTANSSSAALNDMYAWAQNNLDLTSSNIDTTTQQSINDINTTVNNALTNTSGDVNDTSTNAIDAINKRLAELNSGATSVITGLPSDITGLVGQLYDILSEAFKPITDPLSSIKDVINDMGQFMAIGKQVPDAIAIAEKANSTIGQHNSPPYNDYNSISGKIQQEFVALGMGVGSVVGSPFGLLPVVGDCYAAGLGATIQNTARFIMRPSRLPVSDLIKLLKQGLVDTLKLSVDGGEQGYTNDDLTLAVNLARVFLTTGDLVTLLVRGNITDDNFNAYMQMLGYNGDDTNALKLVAQSIPNIGDLMGMAVKQAWNIDLVTQYGLDGGIPQGFIDWAKANGYSDVWALMYWRAHWQYPTASDGFAMVQRGIIDLPDLSGLMDFNGIMPYWRDKLLQLSYTPIPRLVLAGLHKTGVLNDSDLIPRFIKLGYNQDDAALMAKYVIQTTGAAKKADAQPQKDLTKSELLTAFDDGLITSDELSNNLTALGYDVNEIALEIGMAQYKIDKRLHDVEIQIITQRFVNKTISINTAVDELNQLNLPATEQTYQLLMMQKAYELQEAKNATATTKATTKSTATKASASASKATTSS